MVQLLSITSNPLLSMLFVFTFHYGSITIDNHMPSHTTNKSLHSIMVQLLLYSIFYIYHHIFPLHSIMVQLLSIAQSNPS